MFRTGARAEDGRAWVGGWELTQGTGVSKARGFAEEVSKGWAPWAWSKANDPNRTIAALELFATILALKVFKKPENAGGRGVAAVTGSTDNQGNAYAVQKAMSTKYPLALLLMEVSKEMRDQLVVLDLRWTPRESNQEADDLSNLKTSAFDPGLRIRVGPGLVNFIVLDELMEASAKLHAQLVQERAVRAASRAPASAAGRIRKQRQFLSAW